MNIALIGYGRMGKAIEKIARERGHDIAFILDKETTTGDLSKAEVAINFSVPDAAVANLKLCFDAGVPVVCGTTGWLDQQAEIHAYCSAKNCGCLYASNFSIGVNLFFQLNEKVAQLMKNHRETYTPLLEETHHIHKLDAPSGTAISLAEGICKNDPSLPRWTMNKDDEKDLQIVAHREGEVPGTHRITYSSKIDELHIEHKAHSREGFAFGAVIAAEWLNGKNGIFSMNDVLNL